MKNLIEIIRLINTSHKTLYILCGLPYSGKTYLAQEILKDTSCIYVNIDTILEKLGYDWNTNKLPDKQGWEEVMSISYKESQNALMDSHNVLYDSTNHTKASREALRNIALEVGAISQIIYIDVSVDSIRKRWEDNKIIKKRFVLDEKFLEMTISALEIPNITENPWILKN
jgi:predicted kinase